MFKDIVRFRFIVRLNAIVIDLGLLLHLGLLVENQHKQRIIFVLPYQIRLIYFKKTNRLDVTSVVDLGVKDKISV